MVCCIFVVDFLIDGLFLVVDLCDFACYSSGFLLGILFYDSWGFGVGGVLGLGVAKLIDLAGFLTLSFTIGCFALGYFDLFKLFETWVTLI